MKYVIVVPDGMADMPIASRGGKTPMELAHKPNMDRLASKGSSGLLKTVPDGYVPGSDIANLAIMGYGAEYYPGGRGPIEAAVTGAKVGPRDLAFRCNIITEKEDKIIDYSADHISDDDAEKLMKEADKVFGSEKVDFIFGITYRNLFVLRDVDLSPQDFHCEAPHDHMSQDYEPLLIRGDGDAAPVAEKMNEWMKASIGLFEKHVVNDKRRAEGRPLANMLWIWGPGKIKQMPTLAERFGVRGAVITGVDLIRGIGKLAGLDIIRVPGANAYFDTNFEGKADAALEALKKDDIAFVHIEATDEAGHEGLIDEKIKAIEDIDKRVIGRILEGLEGEDFRMAVLPDHPTPVEMRKHTNDPIPFLIYDSRQGYHGIESFSEENAKKGSLGLVDGPKFIELLLEKDSQLN
jgi:2,3-bisphosphoglycerate-independent phosphoglycerate mutase